MLFPNYSKGLRYGYSLSYKKDEGNCILLTYHSFSKKKKFFFSSINVNNLELKLNIDR